MRTETRTIYTLAELKEHKPEAYKRVLARWEKACDESGDCPWSEETMDSLKAVVEACGGVLKDYSIGPWSHSHVRVEVDEEYDTGKWTPGGEPVYAPKDADWLRVHVLKPNGYTRKNGHAYFPGLCKWTGYCADDAFIEAVWKAMKNGDSLKDALEGLADLARESMEEDCENQKGEESMEANWSDNEYDEHGEEV